MALQPEHLLPHSKAHPDRRAVWTPDGELTLGDLEPRIRQLANGLRALGVSAGDAWGVLCHNRLEWAEMTLASSTSGTKYVPLNWHLTPAEIAELLIDSGSRLLVTDETNELAARAAAELAGVDNVIVLGDDYEWWLAEQSDAPLPDGPLGSPLQYTGGTTGRSKGVIRSDFGGNASDFGTIVPRWGDLTGMPRDGRSMLSTPAYHALGGALVRVTLARGHELSILPRGTPEAMLATITDHAIDTTAMVPTQFIRLLKLSEEERARYDVSSLKWVLHSAAPCPPWAKRAMIDWFGPVIIELYGSSEGVGPVICTSEQWLEKPGTVGRASAALSLSIVDDDGNDLPPGEVGTVYAFRKEGPPRYHGDDEKSAAMLLPDGRFTVGDVGWLDDDGFLFLADRRVDLILRAGTNIYPAEIEATLSEHPDIADVAVFGIPDEDWGQSIKAVVEPTEAVGEALDVDGVLAFARERLASFKIPHSIDVSTSLPREASGKLKKRLLRDPYWEAAGGS